MSEHAEPVGGPIFTSGYNKFLLLCILGFAFIGWRLIHGIGAVSALTDYFPFGIWIAFDVVTGTAIGCGGYAMAIVVYILNKGKYHPLIRPAVLTSALGYTMAGFAIAIDVGRYWHIWKIPIMAWNWNLNSALLEVALCVMAYIVVLWLELSPAFLEKWKDSSKAGLARWASSTYGFMNKILIWIVALGLLLPTMHQSSLGTVMMLAGHKLHALWQTPLLPLLFLVSCIAMGYGVVVAESMISANVFKRKPETEMLRGTFGAAALTTALVVVIRFIDIIWRGKIGMALSFDKYSILFWIEMALFTIPVLLYFVYGKKANLGQLFRAGLLFVLAGSLYRFSTYLIAFMPDSGARYFPSAPELLITLGIVALEVMIYVAIVKRFPILAGGTATADAH
jgi:Ni/Fe-hydrogenase subunit HybB-like protein